MTLIGLTIGTIIYCSVTVDVGLNYFEILKVPTKVQYIDKETKDIWLIHQFGKMNKIIKADADAKNIKKHYGEGILKYCSKKAK